MSIEKMSIEKINPQYIYKEIYDGEPLINIFDAEKPTYVLVARPQLDRNRCDSFPKTVTEKRVDTSKSTPDGSLINYPPFVMTPPIEIFNQLSELPHLKHQNVDNFDAKRWVETLGKIITTDADTLPTTTNKIPGYIRKASYPDCVKNVLTGLTEVGDKNTIYAFYICEPFKHQKTGKLMFVKLTLYEEFTFKKKSELWTPKTDRYSVKIEPYYIMVYKTLFRASKSFADLRAWHKKIKEIKKISEPTTSSTSSTTGAVESGTTDSKDSAD